MRVVDFGVARAVDRMGSTAPKFLGTPQLKMGVSVGERLTQLGSILGTPGYMSPEQVRGEESDARSDQFSFCAALYEALYGKLPFAGDSFAEYAENVLARRIQPATVSSEAASVVPLVVEQALKRGLELDPAARFGSMRELAALLSRGLQADAESAQARRRRLRSMWVLGTALSGFAAYRTVALGTGAAKNGIRPVMRVAWISMAIMLCCVAIFRRSISRHPNSRRAIYFGLVMLGGCCLARTCAALSGMDVHRYFRLELIWLAALFAVEVPIVGRRFLWQVLVCAITFLLLVLLP